MPGDINDSGSNPYSNHGPELQATIATTPQHNDDPCKASRVLGARYRRKTKGVMVIGTWTAKGWRCEHGRKRSRCKECGGSYICEHGRERSHCKECGGSSFCEHGRQQSKCKECGGAKRRNLLGAGRAATESAATDVIVRGYIVE